MPISFFTEIDRAEIVLKDRKDLTRLKFLSDVKKYIKGCTYTARKHAKEVLYYWTMRSADVAVIVGISDGDVRNIKTEVSKILYGMFGKDFIKKIVEGTDEEFLECNFVFRNIMSSFKDSYCYFPREYVEVMRSEGVSDTFSLSECKEEYNFLLKHCNTHFKEDLEKVNKDKLCFLLDVLDGKKGTPRERYSISRLLSKTEGKK